jgi:lipopolysaccharide biosynthesis regulator YciM
MKENVQDLNNELIKFKTELSQLKAQLDESNAQRDLVEKNLKLNQNSFRQSIYRIKLE